MLACIKHYSFYLLRCAISFRAYWCLLLLFGGVVDVAEYYIYFHTETHTGARLYMP